MVFKQPPACRKAFGSKTPLPCLLSKQSGEAAIFCHSLPGRVPVNDAGLAAGCWPQHGVVGIIFVVWENCCRFEPLRIGVCLVTFSYSGFYEPSVVNAAEGQVSGSFVVTSLHRRHAVFMFIIVSNFIPNGPMAVKNGFPGGGFNFFFEFSPFFTPT